MRQLIGTTRLPDELTILLIEDSATDVLLIQEMLTRSSIRGKLLHDFRLMSVDTLEEGLQIARRNGIDAILLDLFLRDSQGGETVSRIMDAIHEIPIIIISGLDDELLAIQAVEMGAQDYLIKDRMNDDLLTRSIIYAITRQRAEVENVRWAAVVKQMREGVFITGSDGSIVYVNPAFEKITGYTEKEAVGRDASTIIGASDGESIYNGMSGTISRGETWSGQLTNVHKKGSRYDAEVTCSPVTNSFGQTAYSVTVLRDNTYELALLNQLQQSQKMESIGFLASGIVHDFNNLLTIIITNTELIRLTLDESHPAREMTETIINVSDRAMSLIKQLLTFSRGQKNAPQLVNLHDVVRGMKTILSLLIGRDINLVIKTMIELNEIRMNVTQLEQIILNLAINARDAMPNGGQLAMETSNVTFESEHTAKNLGLPTGDYVLLRVKDSGVGMSPETLSCIFEPFYTTKRGKGTGLGLSTVKGIIYQSAGAIVVHSKLGKGTTFNVYFPKAARGQTRENTTG